MWPDLLFWSQQMDQSAENPLAGPVGFAFEKNFVLAYLPEMPLSGVVQDFWKSGLPPNPKPLGTMPVNPPPVSPAEGC